jgi:hypothetical protein
MRKPWPNTGCYAMGKKWIDARFAEFGVFLCCRMENKMEAP